MSVSVSLYLFLLCEALHSEINLPHSAAAAAMVLNLPMFVLTDLVLFYQGFNFIAIVVRVYPLRVCVCVRVFKFCDTYLYQTNLFYTFITLSNCKNYQIHIEL